MAQSRSLSCALHRARAARRFNAREGPVCPYDPERILVCAARRHPHPARRRWRITAVVHFLLFRVVARLARLSATRVDDALFEFGAFKWLNRIVPFVVIKFEPARCPASRTAAEVADKVLFALIVFLVTMTVSATLSALEHASHVPARSARPAAPVAERRDAARQARDVHHGRAGRDRRRDRQADRPAAVGHRRDVRGADADLQGHAARPRRGRAAVVERHAADRRLDHDAVGRRGRHRDRHHAEHRQGRELRSHDHHRADVEADHRATRTGAE